MTDNNENYQKKLVSLEDAVAQIKSGDTIWMGSTLSIPSIFLDMLSDRYTELNNVTLLGNTFINPSKMLTDPKYRNAFQVISFHKDLQFISPSGDSYNMDYIKKPSGSYTETICDAFNVNVLVTEVCPPDEFGNCNLGTCGRDITPYINKHPSITKRIAVINNLQHPSTYEGGPISIPLSDFDIVCECNHPIFGSNSVEQKSC